MKWQLVDRGAYQWIWLKDYPLFDTTIRRYSGPVYQRNRQIHRTYYEYKRKQFDTLDAAKLYVIRALTQLCRSGLDKELSDASIQTWPGNIRDGSYCKRSKEYLWIQGTWLPWCNSARHYSLRYPASVGEARVNRILNLLINRHRQRFLREYSGNNSK